MPRAPAKSTFCSTAAPHAALVVGLIVTALGGVMYQREELATLAKASMSQERENIELHADIRELRQATKGACACNPGS